MFFHLDNFSVYDIARSTGNIDLTWLTKKYQVYPAGDASGLRYQTWSGGRLGMGVVAAYTGTRSVYLPLGSYLSKAPRIGITQRLLDYQPNGTPICGLSIVGGSTDNHILCFGFTDLKNGFVQYVDKDGIVRKDPFILPVSLTGSQDVIEWGFEKTSSDRSVYTPFSLWVNNRAAYLGEVFSQVGAVSGLAARILGGTAMLEEGSNSSTGFLNRAGNVSVPRCGVTDLVVNDGSRNGLVRVLSRSPVGDVGPNTMVQTGSAASHAELVGTIPPNPAQYLTAISASSEEMYGALAFEGLSSEAVLAVAVQMVGSKNNPFSLNLAGQLRVGGQTREIGEFDVDLSPSFSQVILERNPVTGLPWTPLQANSANFGMKVV